MSTEEENRMVTTNKVVSHFKRKMAPVRPHLQKALDSGDPELVMECLTGKQKQFVEEYLRDLNATRAVLRAGYKTSNAKQMGSAMLANPGVKYAIDYLQMQRAENSDVTSDFVIKEILEIVEKTKTKNPGTAIRGLEIIAKHLGMFINKTEISGPDGNAIELEQRTKQEADAFTRAIAGLASKTGTG